MTIASRVGYAVSLVTLLACVFPSPVWCQNNRVQDELNSALKGKTLLIRDLYSGNHLTYDQNGVASGDTKQGSWTLANVEITGIAVTAQGIEIAGNRMGIWFKDGSPRLDRVGKLKIHVNRPISDVDTQATLQPILSKIFVQDREDRRSILPNPWRSYLEGSDFKSRMAVWQASFKQEPNPVLLKSDASITAPRAHSSPDPEYTKEAAEHHIEGVAVLGIVVDEKGAPDNIAILTPIGMGLDEQAVLAVKRWKFRPAMKNGRAVRVQINVEIGFKCCGTLLP